MTIVVSVPLIVLCDCDVHESKSSTVVVRRLTRYDSVWTARAPGFFSQASWVSLVDGGFIRFDKVEPDFARCGAFGIDITDTIWSGRFQGVSAGVLDSDVNANDVVIGVGGNLKSIVQRSQIRAVELVIGDEGRPPPCPQTSSNGSGGEVVMLVEPSSVAMVGMVRRHDCRSLLVDAIAQVLKAAIPDAVYVSSIRDRLLTLSHCGTITFVSV